MPVLTPIDLSARLGDLSEAWQPRTVATVNEYAARVVKAQGAFAGHSHPETDELFLVLRGVLVVRMRDREVVLQAGQLLVVPRATWHQPMSEAGAEVLLFEPAATVNTGDSPGPLTI